ncbi:MAG TPA: hypothetical protein VEL74_24670 [Thermoanaerobaculia bacterium]|nr:hypothetical protein [Thermoanaerobaculia bacterium]
MKAKLVYVCAMLCVVLLAVVVAPSNTLACSGDDCGCYLATFDCLANCPPIGHPDRLSCEVACNRAEVRCAIACCCPQC